MVTNIKEGKTKKCEQYWPAESRRGQSYGPFNVTVLEQHNCLCRLHYQDYSTCGEYIVDVLFGVFVFKKEICFKSECVTFIKLGIRLELG